MRNLTLDDGSLGFRDIDMVAVQAQFSRFQFFEELTQPLQFVGGMQIGHDP
jgi:hypothetical protein